MVIAMKMYVEHPDLPLVPTIRALPEVELGVFSNAATDPEHDVYTFWIEASDFDAVEQALSEDHTVADYSVILEAGKRKTCSIEYSDDVTLITPGVVEVGGLTLEARSYTNGWLIHLQLQDHDDVFSLNEYAEEHGIHLDLLELTQNDERDELQGYGLTESQREALVSAYVQGYYDYPRNTMLEELASTLDISSTAVSGRLRRGSARLIKEVLVESENGD